MTRNASGATLVRLALAASLLALTASAPALADETHLPVVAKKQVAPGETQTLNPQPIPPGKAVAVGKPSKTGGEHAIIFVGGKKVAVPAVTK
jgi:hypothetical protein